MIKIRCKNKKTFYFLIGLILVCSLFITSTIAIGLNQGHEPQKKTVASFPIIIILIVMFTFFMLGRQVVETKSFGVV